MKELTQQIEIIESNIKAMQVALSSLKEKLPMCQVGGILGALDADLKRQVDNCSVKIYEPIKLSASDLTDEQIGRQKGYRILTNDEIKNLARHEYSRAQPDDIEYLDKSQMRWIPIPFFHERASDGTEMIYRTSSPEGKYSESSEDWTPIAVGHNPHKLNEICVRVHRGERLLSKKEIDRLKDNKIKSRDLMSIGLRGRFDVWDPTVNKWQHGVDVDDLSKTYRTDEEDGFFEFHPTDEEIRIISTSKKVLCIDSYELNRCPTAAKILRQEPYNFNTRAVGIDRRHALIHIEWADEIVVMDREQQRFIETNFAPRKPIINLDISDSYEYMDPQLIHFIKERYNDAKK